MTPKLEKRLTIFIVWLILMATIISIFAGAMFSVVHIVNYFAGGM